MPLDGKLLLHRTAVTAKEMLGMDMSFVSDTRGDRQHFLCVAGDADSFGIEADSSVPLEGTYCDLLLRGELGNIVPDAAREPLVADLPATEAAGVGAYIGVPVTLSDGTTYGTLCCINHEPLPELRERDVRFLEVLARLVAGQLEEQERDMEARRLELAAGSVGALLAALAARDGYTGEHSAAVVDLAVAVGRRLGLDEGQLVDLEHAALLHDIGKIGIPDAILHKPGDLDPEEWSEMRRHPEIGEHIVASMSALAHLAPVIRAEHERWDGAGYPDGLVGDEIPAAAQIVLACDAFHAITSDRPYRDGVPVRTAIAELKRHAGTQFSPRVIEAAVSEIRAQVRRSHPRGALA